MMDIHINKGVGGWHIAGREEGEKVGVGEKTPDEASCFQNALRKSENKSELGKCLFYKK